MKNVKGIGKIERLGGNVKGIENIEGGGEKR